MTNNTFKKALKFVLLWEGGYSNHPNDSGGPTNKGITQRTYDTYRKLNKVPMRTVREITDAEVEDIYYTSYWVPINADAMEPKAAVALFDWAVNSGLAKARGAWASCGNDIKCILEQRRKFYMAISGGKNAVFLKGWLNRLQALTNYVQTI